MLLLRRRALVKLFLQFEAPREELTFKRAQEVDVLFWTTLGHAVGLVAHLLARTVWLCAEAERLKLCRPGERLELLVPWLAFAGLQASVCLLLVAALILRRGGRVGFDAELGSLAATTLLCAASAWLPVAPEGCLGVPADADVTAEDASQLAAVAAVTWYCLFVPIRTCRLWVFPIVVWVSHVVLAAATEPPQLAAGVALKVALLAATFAFVAGSARCQERRVREQWLAAGTRQDERKQQGLATGLTALASCCCDSLVQLTETLSIVGAGEVTSDFFGRNAEGECVTNFMLRPDAQRFALALEEASNAPGCAQRLSVTLLLGRGTCVASAVAVDVGGGKGAFAGEVRYAVGFALCPQKRSRPAFKQSLSASSSKLHAATGPSDAMWASLSSPADTSTRSQSTASADAAAAQGHSCLTGLSDARDQQQQEREAELVSAGSSLTSPFSQVTPVPTPFPAEVEYELVLPSQQPAALAQPEPGVVRSAEAPSYWKAASPAMPSMALSPTTRGELPGAVEEDEDSSSEGSGDNFFGVFPEASPEVFVSARTVLPNACAVYTCGSLDISEFTENAACSRFDSFDLPPPRPRQVVAAETQTQPAPETVEASANTVASWDEDCFVCATCGKPPRPPGETLLKPAPTCRSPVRRRSRSSSRGGDAASSSNAAPPAPPAPASPAPAGAAPAPTSAASGLDGRWLICGQLAGDVADWLTALWIQGSVALDACGNRIQLVSHGGEVFLEGGRIWVANGTLHRTGKSGKTITFRKVVAAGGGSGEVRGSAPRRSFAA